MGANREYKDTLFSKLFSEPSRLRELYNALADTDYGEDTSIELNTLEDVFVSGLKNDVSFVIDGKFVVLVEHQSTVNENMPLRFLLYIARIYEKITDGRAVYQENLLKIPTPELIVLYNGAKPFPTEKTLKLSDAFIASDKSLEKFGGLELTVRVVNINPNGNKELLKKSKTLNDYTAFVERVRHNRSVGIELRDAISEAIKWGVEEGILMGFLQLYGSEVQNMLFTEFNIDIAKEVWQEESRAEGRTEGRAEGRSEGRSEGRAEGIMEVARKMLRRRRPLDEIVEDTGLSHDEIELLRDSN